MKIAFISGLYPPAVIGGAEIVLQTLVEGVRDQGHDVLVITTKEEGKLVQEFVNEIPVIRVPIKNIYWHGRREHRGAIKRAIWHAIDSANLSMLSIARKILQEERPDALNVHAIEGWSAGVLAIGKSLGIPTVQVLHSWNFMCPNSNMFRKGHACKTRCLSCKILRMRHRSISDSADAVVGVSQFILDGHLSEGYFSKARHHIAIHNARDLHATELEPPCNRASGCRENLVFGFIGTLNPAKGVERLIEEFLALGIDAAELWIAGKGKPQYEAELISRYASSQVKFMGYLKQADFFPHIDVLVVPTLCEEALGMVVPEAFAFGLPVIASRRGGIPEMVRDGENGCLFEPNNRGELADVMASFLRGEQDTVSMRNTAKASAHQYLDVEAWVDKYIRINQDLVSMRGN
ncbi:glycosyltransferase family 4 protein [Paraburkholderia fungorum]|uniref:glycosyltransferase family 4 protein n=1 Tax=Paraburkholderia fungorum TaxID=134537 RepID=UPI0038B836BD